MSDPRSVCAKYVAVRLAGILNYALANGLAVAMDDEGVWMGLYTDDELLAQVALDLDADGESVVWRGSAVDWPWTA